MAEVFISYKSERRRAAEHLAAVLERYGYSVWFDYQLIKGRDFGLQIDRRVREAKALVVLWCTKSVSSRWVAEEVDLAHELGILVPVKIESCALSVGFRRQDYIDLSEWDGAPRSHQLDPLIDALEQKVGRAPAPDFKALRDLETTWRRYGALALRDFAFDKSPASEEGDRGLPDRADPRRPNAGPRSNGDQHSLLALAAEAWPAVRDSGDPRRLLRFEQHFARTYYAEEARELREAIEAADRRRLVEEAEQAEAARLTSEGYIQLRIGDGRSDEIRWLRSGADSSGWFKDFSTGPQMIVVPAGEFMMGSPEGEGGDAERPRHKVTIKDAFAVGMCPVTRGEFAAFIGATNRKIELGAYVWNSRQWKEDPSKSWRDPGFRQDDDHPVACVNWHDAQAYVAWLRERSGGKPYRLLSEAEWEYCCRAGATSVYSTGKSITPAQANFGQNAKGTTSVFRFPPNAWGLRDMHGNVWEWCEDNWHGDYSGGLPTDGSVWRGGDKSSRVLRGGSWGNLPQVLRSAIRDRGHPVFRDNYVGFRVARTL
jgi:formylglycine-generating enzyme required for sulfatase activity